MNRRVLATAAVCGLALLAALVNAADAQGTTLLVPSVYGSVSLAESSAQPGYAIRVTSSGSESQKLTIDVDSLTVTVDPGVTWTVTGGAGDNLAMDIAADGVLVDGLTLRAGSNPSGIVLINGASEVRNCTIEDNGYECTAYGVDLLDGAILRDCTVTMTSGSGRAVIINWSTEAAPAQIVGNTLDVALESTGTYVEGIYIYYGTYAVIDDNVIVFSGGEAGSAKGVVVESGHDYTVVTDNIITGDGDRGIETMSSHMDIQGNLIEGFTYGIHMFSGADQDLRENTIVWDACSSGSYGIWTGISFSSAASTFANNLIVNTETGMLFNTAVSGSWTISHNAFWSDGAPSCGTGSNRSLTSSQLATDLEPIFCAEREAPVSKYTQRIDSQVAPGNNPWGELVGRWGVECAFGELEYDATLLDNESAIVLEDVVVPSGKTLTMEGGAHLLVDDDDNSSSGRNTSINELVIEGALVVTGSVPDTAKFVSSKTTQAEGDWYGIVVESGGEASIDYAEIMHAVYGVKVDSNESSTITHSRFGSNQTYDIMAGAASGTTLPLRIAHNTITVGGGTGIEFQSVANGAVVDSNAVIGSTVSGNGIALDQFTYGSDVDLTGNSVSGFTNGAGVSQGTTANLTMIQNSISYCKWGVKVTEGSPTIGTTADSDNFLMDNVSGVYAEGQYATPVVRNNYISSNTYGVQAKTGALPDLGTGTSDRGYNYLDGNTTYCIWNRTVGGTSLPAQYNYFGECDQGVPPVCSYGNVDDTNGLCTEPAKAGQVHMVEEAPLPPRGFRIAGVVPNPMLSGGEIQLALAQGQTSARLDIFDVTGRLVRSFGEFQVGQGQSPVRWDGRNEQGVPVRSGIYFVRARSSEGHQGSARILVAR